MARSSLALKVDAELLEVLADGREDVLTAYLEKRAKAGNLQAARLLRGDRKEQLRRLIDWYFHGVIPGEPEKKAKRRRVAESKESGYTGEAPPSEAAVTSPPLRMGDDDFNIAVKQARTETLARLVDLGNPTLSDDQKLTRARRLVRSYDRRRAENPDFPESPDVKAARSLVNRVNYQNKKAKTAKTPKPLIP